MNATGLNEAIFDKRLTTKQIGKGVITTAKLCETWATSLPPLDPERWVDEHGDYLFRYALSRLRDPVQAEYSVQEALLAALRCYERFEGRSSERSWLTGILKNKILDYFRKVGRETSFTDLEFYGAEEERSFENSSFAGRWNPAAAPSEWEDAGDALDKQEFWKVFHRCLGKLPDRVARVFLLREVDGLSSDQICAALNISPENLWVMLHRARLALRRSLELNWFGTHPLRQNCEEPMICEIGRRELRHLKRTQTNLNPTPLTL